jgi:RNase adaptor protein for sRNA GlmZ degradation
MSASQAGRRGFEPRLPLNTMLTVNIYSFGYHKSGIPSDATPNNGGFVFDCRFITNPRWIEKLKNLTGKDADVIAFLDADKKMQEYFDYISKIVSDAIENFMSRDFTNLMISFGCTGGQHRSIYAAEKLYDFLKTKYNGKIILKLTHTEYPDLP